MRTESPHETFERHLRGLQPIADLNAAAVKAVLDPEAFDHSNPAEAHYAPQAIGLGIASLYSLLRPLQLYWFDLENANAVSKAAAAD